MNHEMYYQINLFTNDLTDNRTRKQKIKSRQQVQPRQMEMFSQRELAQFGVEPHPKLPISPKTRLELALEDARTEAEKEKGLQQKIEEMTYPMPWVSAILEELSQSDT